MNPVIYKNDQDSTIWVVPLSEYISNLDNLVKYGTSMKDGKAVYVDGYEKSSSKLYNYRGNQIIGHNENNKPITKWIWDTVEQINTTKYNLAVYNEITANQNPVLNIQHQNELDPQSYITIINLGTNLTIQFTPNQGYNSESMVIPFGTGDILSMALVPKVLSVYSYKFIITDKNPRSIMTFVRVDKSKISNNILKTDPIKNGRPSTPVNNRLTPTLNQNIYLRDIGIIPKLGNEDSKREKYIKPTKLNIGQASAAERPLDKFELTKIISIRADHIEDNSPIFVEHLPHQNPALIAGNEIKEARKNSEIREKLNYIEIIRHVDGEKVSIPIGQLLTL